MIKGIVYVVIRRVPRRELGLIYKVVSRIREWSEYLFQNDLDESIFDAHTLKVCQTESTSKNNQHIFVITLIN